MSNYLIKLTPVGKYFFGGDMTFSVGAKDYPKDWKKLSDTEKTRIKNQIENNTRYSSYIIKSEKFPQQTSLLGMLRYLMLRNSPSLFDINKNIIREGEDIKKLVKDLIGETGFIANDEEKKENVFGQIKRISPCFIMNGDNVITQLPMDYGFEIVDLSGAKQLYNDNAIYLSEIISGRKDNGDKRRYSAKDGIYTRYGDGKTLYDENEIFIEDHRIGINRNIETGHTEDNALFKQVNYRLADGFCFAFYAEVDMNIKSHSCQIVSLGADNSQFVIQISPSDFHQIALPSSNVKTKGCNGKIVLTSPALIDKEIAKKADFAMTETIPFKYMKTNIGLNSYHRLSGISHSKKEYLFQTGSVFYFKSSEKLKDFKDDLENRKDFFQIGYNHFQIVQF